MVDVVSRKCSCRKSRRGGRAGVVFFFRFDAVESGAMGGGASFFFLEAALRSFFDKNRLSTKT